MKILVFGAGAIGSAFGGFLSQFHDVTLLGRKWHLEKIARGGLQVEGIWGRHRFQSLKLATKASHLFRSKPFFNLILVTVKSFDTPEVARFLQGRIGPKTLVLSIQNGIGNIDTLKRYLPPKQILAGRVIFGVVIGPGKIKITVIADKTRIGETTEKRTTERVKFLAEAFSYAGLPTEAVPDVEKYLWAKLIYNCALNPLASLLGVHYGALTEAESTRFLMDEVIREVYRVAKKKKQTLEPSTAEGYRKLFYRRLVPLTYHHLPSMLQDLRRGKPTEIEGLSGAVVRLGKSLRMQTPFNQLLTDAIHSREAR